MKFKQDDDFYEIPPSSIKEIGREIGKGAFGRVYIARISEIPGKVSPQIVAIKKLKSKSFETLYDVNFYIFCKRFVDLQF